MNNSEKLIKLIQENPTLKVIPMVECEVVLDDSYSWWIGDWGSSEVMEVYYGRDHIHFRSDDEEDVLVDMVGCKYGETKDGKDIFDLSDEEWTALFNSLEWEKVIAVYITT